MDIDAAAYYMAKKNFFFRDADGFNVNDGRTRHVGAELEARARATSDLSFEANVAYGRHTYRFDRAVTSLPQQTEKIAKGDDVDTAPRWLAGARALWTPGPFMSEFEWVHVSSYFTDAANTQTYPGHHLFNLRVGYEIADSLSLGVAVRNLFDKLYAERADFAFGEERYFPGEERTISVSLSAKL